MDAVRVLTIHKAKGLQYPVVIIPDADFKLRSTKKFLWAELHEDFTGNVSVFPLPVEADLEHTEYGGLYKKEMADSLLDMVNLLYVATTRPEERLYMISEKPETVPDKLNSITALLIRFLKDVHLWDGFQQYEFGDPETSKDLSKPAKESFKEFQYTPVINYHQKQLAIRRSSELKWSSNGSNATLLRQVLSEMDYAKDASVMTNKYYQLGILSSEEKMSLENDLREILSHWAMADLFSKKWMVYRNQEISSGGRYTYTADRLMIDKVNGRAAVINYRTSGEAEKDAVYISECTKLIRGEYVNVDKWIIYTDSKQIVKIN
jgi:ATP-dependent exoDNAse (exonuclease V) beta subunit